MKIRYTQKAVKEFKQFPLLIQKRIAKKMRFYARQDNPIAFAKRLVNPQEGEFRFRVGDYRLLFDVDLKENRIFVLKIEKRDKAYD